MVFTRFDFEEILEIVKTDGYYFGDIAKLSLLDRLTEEVQGLKLEEGDHVNYPINQKSPSQQVQQLHLRSYHELDDPKVPVASQVCHSVSKIFQQYSGLETWLPNEIGYQVYRNQSDWISPHRDRSSDCLLSITFTISGAAWIKIYESEVEPPDYTKLKQVDQYLAVSGTVMFLRASGFGIGDRIIHEVCPPLVGERKILNLRTRATILKSPKEWSERYLLKKNFAV